MARCIADFDADHREPASAEMDAAGAETSTRTVAVSPGSELTNSLIRRSRWLWGMR